MNFNKQLLISLTLSIIFIQCSGNKKLVMPHFQDEFSLIGDFQDDYNIDYSISDSTWILHPNYHFQILIHDMEEQYLICKNGLNNSSEAGLFSRIDYIKLKENNDYQWAFCLSKYDATTAEEAESSQAADKSNPMNGCNGFPFSRMKRK